MPLKPEAAARKDRNNPTRVSLQHRHFAFIAATLAETRPPPDDAEALDMWNDVVLHFARNCATTNAAFLRNRFLDACEYVGKR